jgi:hypothetical protein
MTRTLALAAVLLMVCTACHQSARQGAGPAAGPRPVLEASGREARGPNKPRQAPARTSPGSAWVGRPIGELIASWGKPVKIRPLPERPGHHDYVFQSQSRRAGFSRPHRLLGPGFHHAFGARFGHWGHDLWDEYEGIQQIDCRAVVGVDAGRKVSRVSLENQISCARCSPFGLAPPEVIDGQI